MPCGHVERAADTVGVNEALYSISLASPALGPLTAKPPPQMHTLIMRE